MEIECIGKLYADGKILIDPSLVRNAMDGSRVKIIIVLPEKVEKPGKKALDPATKRIFERMRNAKALGAPDDPQELSPSKLMEERMNEKYPVTEREDNFSDEPYLKIAEQDWADWADPEEDIYEEYRKYAQKG
jgi:hypothetical protein